MPPRATESTPASRVRPPTKHGPAGSVASPPEPFEVRVAPHRRAVHLEPVGELDLASAPTLQTHAAELVERGFDQLVIDLSGLAFIDVAGVRLLLTLYDHARRDGWRLSIIPGPSPVQRVFAVTGTLDSLPFSPVSAAGDRRQHHSIGSAYWVG